MSGRRILVAGGAGFIGSHLCRALMEGGDSVICVDNLSTGRAASLGQLMKSPSFQFFSTDVSLTPDLDADAVLHLASPASPVHYRRLAIETLRANSAGTERLLEIAMRNEAPFIYFSTSEVYGDPQEHPQHEDYRGNVSSTGPRACYDEGKRYGEALTLEYHRQHGVGATILRLFNTYGPGMALDDGRAIPAFITAVLRGSPVPIQGDGKQTRSLCYVGDLVRGVRLVLDDPEPGGVFNIGNPVEMTVLDIAHAVARLAGVRPEFQYLPAAEDDPARRQPDISRIRARYGWQPETPLAQGLRATIEDFAARLNVPIPEYAK